MALDERQRLIEACRAGHAAIMKALAGLTDAGLDRAPPGEWSARQIVHHLADTEQFRSVRLRQLLSQDEPVIQAFDELKLVERAYYGRPVAASLAVFDAAVHSSLELLSLMSEADWIKAGVHTELGLFTMDMWLQRAADHLSEHAAQVRERLTS